MISNTNKLISERGEICKDADIDDSVSESVGPQTFTIGNDPSPIRSFRIYHIPALGRHRVDSAADGKQHKRAGFEIPGFV